MLHIYIILLHDSHRIELILVCFTAVSIDCPLQMLEQALMGSSYPVAALWFSKGFCAEAQKPG